MITNKRDCEKKHLVLEADRYKMEELRKNYYNEVNKNYYKIKNGYSDEQMNQVNPALYANFDSKQLHDGFENENLLEF